MTANGTEGGSGNRQKLHPLESEVLRDPGAARRPSLGNVPICPEAVAIGSKQLEEVAVTAREIEDRLVSVTECFSESPRKCFGHRYQSWR